MQVMALKTSYIVPTLRTIKTQPGQPDEISSSWLFHVDSSAGIVIMMNTFLDFSGFFFLSYVFVSIVFYQLSTSPTMNGVAFPLLTNKQNFLCCCFSDPMLI